MSAVRKCYNADCENNYMGGYCECSEITIDENGCCTSCLIVTEEKESEVAERREDIENNPADCSTPSVTDSKGDRNEQIY